MRLKIGVVGVGGVGMAHVVAGVRSGNDVLAIVDTDNKVLQRAMGEWSNKWGAVEEKSDINKKCVYSNEVHVCKNLDLVIVATPPETHLPILRELQKLNITQIIVEKPISTLILVAPLYRNVNVSAEWIYHSQLDIGDKVKSLHMSFAKSSTTKWIEELNPVFDFVPHFLSIILHLGYSITNIKFTKISNDSFTGEILTTEGSIGITGYRPKNSSHGGQGFFIDNEEFKWERELFDIQINNRGGISWEQMLIANNMLIVAYQRFWL